MIVIEKGRLPAENPAVEDWWRELDHDVLACLAGCAATEPAEIGRRLGISEDAAASVLSILAQEGKVRIRLVELV